MHHYVIHCFCFSHNFTINFTIFFISFSLKIVHWYSCVKFTKSTTRNNNNKNTFCRSTKYNTYNSRSNTLKHSYVIVIGNSNINYVYITIIILLILLSLIFISLLYILYYLFIIYYIYYIIYFILYKNFQFTFSTTSNALTASVQPIRTGLIVNYNATIVEIVANSADFSTITNRIFYYVVKNENFCKFYWSY